MTRVPSFALRPSRLSYEQYESRLDFYARERWEGRGERFLYLPEEPPAHRMTGSRVFREGTREELRYPSRYAVRNPGLAEAFTAARANLDGYLYLWRHGGEPKRPLVLCLHGFAMGAPARAFRMFRIGVLYDLGLDVALFTLPHHGRRKEHRMLFDPYLQAQDAPLTIETVAQSVHDLHSAVLLLRALGYERMGAIGASLGGYTALLYATAANPLCFIFLVVPLVDLTAQMRPRRARLAFAPDANIESKSRQALQRVSPLDLEPVFDPEDICIVAHTGDRMCPIEHTRELVDRWRLPCFLQVVGGHWVYLDRDARGRAWYEWLGKKGFIQP
jgi:hypothetical protein